jgi:hypothetical protein
MRFQHFVLVVELRVHALVGRVAEDVPLPVVAALGPVRRQPRRAIGRQARVVLHEALGHGIEAVVRAQLHRRAQFVEPLAVALGRVMGPAFRQAEAFQVDEAPHPLRAHAGIDHHHVAAHAVADEVDRLVGRQRLQQRVEVAEVVGEPVAVGGGRFAAAEAAPVGRHDPALARQRIDDELVRRADVHPAMGEHQRRLAGRRRAPGVDVAAQAAHGDEFAARRAARDIGGGHAPL